MKTKQLLTLTAISVITVLNLCTIPDLSGQTINTFAGNGTLGNSGDGGAATSAQIATSNAVAKDASGNVYIGGDGNCIVRKVNTSGVISTFAGTVCGYAGNGGAATSAQLNGSSGITVDASGNVYIVDAGNYRVRKVNTSGIISNFAGNGTSGYSGDGGAATSAMLSAPRGVAVDASGNVYIADQGGHRIRKVNTSGIISTFAGTGTSGYSGNGGAATSARLSGPRGVAVDASGNVYIAEFLTHIIRKVNTSGIISTFAGIAYSLGSSGDGGAATSALLYNPYGVAVDASNNVYIADYNNFRLRMVNTSGIISRVAGTTAGYSGDGGAATSAQLNIRGVAVDASCNVYIADGVNYRVRIVSPVSGCVSLPIELLSFDATPVKDTNGKYYVRCEWSTATEINNDYFTIERSRDGKFSVSTFAQIGTVKGAGNSSGTLYYEFDDQLPYTDLSYYRLKQTDYDGKFSYSNIVAVYIGGMEIISVYPNPAEKEVKAKIAVMENTEATVEVINVLGEQVVFRSASLKKGTTEISINTEKLAQGNYIFKATLPSKEHVQKMFVK